ncbi:MAG: transcription termination factor NusA [Pirellulales bacterium]
MGIKFADWGCRTQRWSIGGAGRSHCGGQAEGDFVDPSGRLPRRIGGAVSWSLDRLEGTHLSGLRVRVHRRETPAGGFSATGESNYNMNPSELMRIVDAIHRDKNIDKEIVFEGIEAALVSAAKKYYGEDRDIVVTINREDGSITGTCDGEPLDPEETVGRIGAQTAKQVMIQKIREAECESLYEEYHELIGQMVTGVIQRYDGGAATVSLSNVEALLPRSEQIPGETHHPNERVRTTVFEVRKTGSRVRIILSRIRPQLVQRLFEQEIPEIIDGVIGVRAMAREPGYRSKVAVSSSDLRVDCVGACVGVRGNRIKNIVDELAGERIDIVRWSDDLEVFIPNALQPAEVEQVILCKMLGRAIVLVREDQLSLAIGRRGQNVRLASKLSGWDIEIMTQEELAESIDRAVGGFSELEGVDVGLAEKLVEEGFLSYDDLSVIEPDALQEMGGLSEEAVEAIVNQAEGKAEEAEIAAAEQRRRRREQDRLEAANQAKAEAEAKAAAETEGTAEADGDQDGEVAEEGAEAGEGATGEESEPADVPDAAVDAVSSAPPADTGQLEEADPSQGDAVGDGSTDDGSKPEADGSGPTAESDEEAAEEGGLPADSETAAPTDQDAAKMPAE